jgi:bifunctional NMN adenylyltransferase/nudix hydrolase
LAVVIGRFHPFHFGHLALIEQALSVAPRVLVVVGSAGGPRVAKNPFSVEERSAAIAASLSPEQRARVAFAGVRDYYDEPRWARAVRAAATRETSGSVVLVGFHKDSSSSYLSGFPEWRELALPRQAPHDATALRRLYYSAADGAPLPQQLLLALPPPVASFLAEFRRGEAFGLLREELHALDESRAKYGSGPFVTVDAVVTLAGSVLLVQRGRAPGKGLWALPGGFLDGDERLLDAALRELDEETLVECTPAELRAAFQGAAVFDHPARSRRGRTITHAHHFALPGNSLPRVQGADDAQAARWTPLAELPRLLSQLFDDHYQILDHFLRFTTD